MAARRYEISLRVLKNISRVSENFSQVFTQKLLWYFIGVYIIKLCLLCTFFDRFLGCETHPTGVHIVILLQTGL